MAIPRRMNSGKDWPYYPPMPCKFKIIAKDRIIWMQAINHAFGLYLSSPDGSNEHSLLAGFGSSYNPSFSLDGRWIVFTSERYGSADVFRVHPDGSAFSGSPAGGSQLGVNDELHQIIGLVPEDVKVIPGRGMLAPMNEVHEASQALDGTRDAIAAQIAKGTTLKKIQELKLLDLGRALLTPFPKLSLS